ncbi:MAG: hypothetical protein R2939_17950 [Kofleriaceae bacterium]
MRATRSALLVTLLLACGGSSPPPAGPGPGPAPDDGLTEIRRRQNAACEALGPVLTACAVEDARTTMTPEEFDQLALEQTAPQHTAEFIEACEAPDLGSRTVRVYEVCLREESECEPLLACLDHVHDPAP